MSLVEKHRIGLAVAFEKTADPSGRFVRGWASVATVDGQPVVDWDGDRIALDELRTAAHDFVKSARKAKLEHRGEAIGEIIESVIIDDAFAKAIGATTTRRGWWIGMEIHSETVRAEVRKGKLPGFSIAGKGRRRKEG